MPGRLKPILATYTYTLINTHTHTHTRVHGDTHPDINTQADLQQRKVSEPVRLWLENKLDRRVACLPSLSDLRSHVPAPAFITIPSEHTGGSARTIWHEQVEEGQERKLYGREPGSKCWAILDMPIRLPADGGVSVVGPNLKKTLVQLRFSPQIGNTQPPNPLIVFTLRFSLAKM